MLSVPPKNNEEIDLFNLIEVIWDGKWKILSLVLVFLLTVFGFNTLHPNTTFIATTEIKPITSFEIDKYRSFNSSLKVIKRREKDDRVEKEDKEDNEYKEYKKDIDDKIFNFFEITQEFLISLYIENLEEGTLLETAIDKYDLINRNDFESENDYRQAIEKFASQIEILGPIKQNNKTRSHYLLKVRYDNIEKWKKLLLYLSIEANESVKNNIVNRFRTMVSVQKQKKEFSIKDIEIKIDNAKKDYDKNTQYRLAFLAEQAAIARKLDISKNTISSQRFNTQDTSVTNVTSNHLSYLRGYLAIEEEIKQINTRKDKTSFVKSLFKLEQQKRELEQDKTINRTVDLFNKTPLNESVFRATQVKVAITDFKMTNKRSLSYILALVFGSLIGVLYILVANAFKIRKQNQ